MSIKDHAEKVDYLIKHGWNSKLNVDFKDYLDQPNPDVDGKFEPPTTVVELLERACHMAKEEDSWASGDWFRTKDEPPKDENQNLDYSQFSCGNVKACAMGLLILATYNGPLVRSYYRQSRSGDYEIDLGTLCRLDPLISEAAPILSASFIAVADSPKERTDEEKRDAYTRERTDEKLRSTSDSIDEVINYNDTRIEETAADRNYWLAEEARMADEKLNPKDKVTPHGLVVEAFEFAVDRAREAAAS